MTQYVLPKEWRFDVATEVEDCRGIPTEGWVTVRLAKTGSLGERVFSVPAESLTPVGAEPEVPFVAVGKRVFRRDVGQPGWLNDDDGRWTWAQLVAFAVEKNSAPPRPLVYADSPDDTPARCTRPWQPGNVR